MDCPLKPEHLNTWVTTYEFVPECPPDSTDGEYWYCWGDCRTTPPVNNSVRLLGARNGDVDFALRLGSANDAKSDFGLRYGVDGVCHQMANRLLYSTRSEGQHPLTVEKAKGYFLSQAMYGTYGGKGKRGRKVRERWDRMVEEWLGDDKA